MSCPGTAPGEHLGWAGQDYEYQGIEKRWMTLIIYKLTKKARKRLDRYLVDAQNVQTPQEPLRLYSCDCYLCCWGKSFTTKKNIRNERLFTV